MRRNKSGKREMANAIMGMSAVIVILSLSPGVGLQNTGRMILFRNT